MSALRRQITCIACSRLSTPAMQAAAISPMLWPTTVARLDAERPEKLRVGYCDSNEYWLDHINPVQTVLWRPGLGIELANNGPANLWSCGLIAAFQCGQKCWRLRHQLPGHPCPLSALPRTNKTNPAVASLSSEALCPRQRPTSSA